MHHQVRLTNAAAVTRALASTLLLAIPLVLVHPAAAATVKIRLIDAASAKPAPAMVCITALADGSVRMPPNGEPLAQPSSTRTFYEGVRFSTDNDWVGPARKTAGKGNNDDRGFPYEHRLSIPYWPEPVMYQTTGDFGIRLDAGRYRISVYRGTEFVPVAEEFEVTPGAADPITRDIQVKRWIDLPAKGWWSGDVHVHHPLLDDTHAEYLLSYAAASDLNIINLLEMGHHQGTEFKQRAFGPKARVQRGNHWIIPGQEEPRSMFGHIIGLNTTGMVRDVATYDFYDVAFRGIRSQPNAVLGFAHFSWNGCELPRGFSWYIVGGEIEFIELMQFNMVNALDYYDYLNLGFQLTAAAGSDTPWGSTIGEVRTYVHTGEKLDADAWFANLKKGHTFVTNGPAIEFTVNGRLPGSQITARSGDAARIAVKVLSHGAIGIPKTLTLIGNDGIVQQTLGDGRKTTLEFELDHQLDRSQWLAVSAVCENGALAHTTPIYITVDGRPTWSSLRGPLVIQKQLDQMAVIEAEFARGTDERSKGVIERLQKAKRFYADLLAKMSAAQ